MSMIPHTPENGNRNNGTSNKKAGLFIYPYALKWMAGGLIKPREMLLLSLVDKQVNRYEVRQSNVDRIQGWDDLIDDLDYRDEDRFPVPAYKAHRLNCLNEYGTDEWVGDFEVECGWVPLSVSYLRKRLCCSDDTVLSTIKSLNDTFSVRPELFQARRVPGRFGRQHWWEMTTTRRERPKSGFLFVPAKLCQWFETEHLSIREMLLCARVYSFNKNGKPCYTTNATFGKELGITKYAAKRLVRNLKDMGFLNAADDPHGYGLNLTKRYLGIEWDLMEPSLGPNLGTP